MSSRNRPSARAPGGNPGYPGRGSKLDPDQYATRLLRLSIFGHGRGSADSSLLLPLLSHYWCGIDGVTMASLLAACSNKGKNIFLSFGTKYWKMLLSDIGGYLAGYMISNVKLLQK